MMPAAALLWLCVGAEKGLCGWRSPGCSYTLGGYEHERPRSLAYAPDGLLAVGGGTTITLSNLSSGEDVWRRTYEKEDGYLTDMMFSPDGTMLAVAWGDGGVSVQTATGSTLWEDIDVLSCISVAFSPSGNTVAAGSGYVIQLREATTGHVDHVMSGHTGIITGLQYSPDGTHLASVADDTARVWDVKSRTPLTVLHCPDLFFGDMAFSRDGKWFATGGASAAVWDTATYSLVANLTGAYIKQLVFSADGSRVLTGGVLMSALVWDTQTGVFLKAVLGHADGSSDIALSPDGSEFVTAPVWGNQNLTIWQWDVVAAPSPPSLPAPPAAPPAGNRVACSAHSNSSCSYILTGFEEVIAFSITPDANRVVVGDSNGLAVVDVTLGTVLLVVPASSVQDVLFSPDETMIAVASFQGVALIDAITGQDVWRNETSSGLPVWKSGSHSIAFSPDGRYLVCGDADNSLRIRDVHNGGVTLRTLVGHTSYVTRVRYSPDGTLIASGSEDGTSRLWDADTGLQSGQFDTDAPWLSEVDVAFSPDGSRVVTSGTEGVTVWSTSPPHTRIFTSPSSGGPVAFSPDGTRVFVGSQSFQVWDATTGAILDVLNVIQGEAIVLFRKQMRLPRLQFVLGGVQFATAAFSEVTVWSSGLGVPTPTPIPVSTPAPAVPSCATDSQPLSGPCGAGAPLRCALRILHVAKVLSVAHSPDGEEIAAGSADGVVRVFAAASGAHLRSLGCAGFAAHDIAFSPDGAHVAVAGAGGRVVVCNATSGEALLQLEKGRAAATVRRVRFSNDGRLVVAGGVQEAVTRVHNIAGPSPELVLHMHTREAAFVAGGTQVATVQGETGEAVRVFAVRNGEQVAEVPSGGVSVTALSFSPDEKELARGMDDGTVHLGPWSADANSTSPRLQLQHRSGFVFDVHHSPDGRLLAAAGMGSVTIWDASTGAVAADFVWHSAAVNRLSFSPDGTRVATAGHDANVYVWDVSGL